MRPWITVLTLSLLLAGKVSAGELHSRIEGPAPDGVTYTVRTLNLAPSDQLEPWALAEGVVDGHRRSQLIRLEPAGEHGVYRFTRTWSGDGHWMIRLLPGHPPAPVTVATLDRDGSVKANTLYHDSDGAKECHQALKKWVKGKPGEDDC